MMITPTQAGPGPRPSPAAVDRVLKALASSIGADRVLRDPKLLDVYSRDESGFGSFVPDAVVRAHSAEEVSIVLKEASLAGVPVTPRGGGTGRVGGALPICGGIVLSLEQMNRVLEIDRENFHARVEPGLILQNFEKAVEEAGLFYPPDPSSLESCSVGGNVACNAGGPRALKYGVTANYVLGLQAVLPTGEILETGRKTVKGGAGYDLHKLLVGSEGTLAVITGITFKLIACPNRVETALIPFADAQAASRAVTEIMRAGILPRSMEFMDRTSLQAARTKAPRHLPEKAGACLIVEVDGHEGLNDNLFDQIAKVGEICEKNGCQEVFLAQDEQQRRDLWMARRELSPILREAYPCKVSEDVVLPRNRLPEAVERLEAIAAKHGITIATFGHAGDGNVHINSLFDEARRENANRACADILKLTVELGGTVAGEHGTGLQKVEALALEQKPELLEFQGRLKRFFDPAGILNPGKVVPLKNVSWTGQNP